VRERKGCGGGELRVARRGGKKRDVFSSQRCPKGMRRVISNLINPKEETSGGEGKRRRILACSSGTSERRKSREDILRCALSEAATAFPEKKSPHFSPSAKGLNNERKGDLRGPGSQGLTAGRGEWTRR